MGLRNAITIREATHRDIAACYELIRQVSAFAEDAEDVGFLAVQGNVNDLQAFLGKAIFFVVISDQVVLGFIIFLPPSHPRFVGLKQKEEQFSMPEHFDWQNPNLFWVAKVVVARGSMRKGVGSALYQEFYRRFPCESLVTAIVEKPLKNKASAALHKKVGFERVGSFRAETLGLLTNTESGIYYRKA